MGTLTVSAKTSTPTRNCVPTLTSTATWKSNTELAVQKWAPTLTVVHVVSTRVIKPLTRASTSRAPTRTADRWRSVSNSPTPLALCVTMTPTLKSPRSRTAASTNADPSTTAPHGHALATATTTRHQTLCLPSLKTTSRVTTRSTKQSRNLSGNINII